MNKKVALFTIAMVLLLGVTMGVTFALMTAKSQTVTNTFVAGGFGDLTLLENKAIADPDNPGNYVLDETNPATVKEQTYTIVPGAELYKDPYLSFKYADGAAQVPYYLFFKIDGENWTDNSGTIEYKLGEETVLSFSVDTDNWVKIDDSDSIIYASKSSYPANSGEVNIIKNQTVKVNDDLTGTTLETIGAEGFAIDFIGYAIQAGEASDGAGVWDAGLFPNT